MGINGKDVVELKNINTNTIERGNEMAFDRRQYDNDYKREHKDQLNIRIPKGSRDLLIGMAERQGKGLTKFIRDALYYYMDALGEEKIDLG